MGNYRNIIERVELINIKQDLLAIKALFPIIHPSLSPFLLPYVSLHCYEIKIYFENKGDPLDTTQKSVYSMKEIRNKVKLFNLKSMQKIMNASQNINNEQDDCFAKKMRFPLLKKLNLHYNLGMYYLNNKNVFNTQYVAYIFQKEKDISKKDMESNQNLDSEEMKKYGSDLGIIIDNVLNGFKDIKTAIPFEFRKDNSSIMYSDFNTNKKYRHISEEQKSLNLFMLHLTSNIGFVLYALKELIIQDNGFLLKVEYILYHYVINSLWTIYNNCVKNKYYSDTKLKNCITQIKNKIEIFPSENNLYNSNFRSAILHYELINPKDKTSLINEKELDLNKTLFGLIETQFPEYDYNSFRQEIEERLEIVYNLVNFYLDFNDTELQLLLDPNNLKT